VLGNGGVGLGVRCRVGARALRCSKSAACAGMQHTLSARWATRSCRFGVVGAACTVGLGSRRLKELVVEVDTRLVVR
jgi:hypothetical protein